MAEPVKKLGKLSLAILENFVEGVLGEKFVDELRAPTDRELVIARALGEAENLFIAKFDDKELSNALFIDLKQADRPVLREAVGKYFDHPTDPSLRQNLQEILFDEFKSVVSKEQIDRAVDFYMKLLTKELMLADETFRDNIASLAIYEGNLSEQRQVELLEQIAERIVNQQAASQQIFRSLHQLPSPLADFTGREIIIEELLKDFESHKGATISGLTGMGGIGKTALGLEVAHKIAKKYPDAQIFLDLKGTSPTPLSATDIMRHVILSFEPAMDLRALNDANVSAKYYSALHEKKILLFLDNARSAEQIAPLRPSETCAMLITSRWSFPVTGLKPHKVGVLEENEAIAFLLELCQRIDDKADDLARACAYLPLALRIAGSFLLVNEDWPIEKYLTQLSDRKKRLATLQESHAEAELKSELDLVATFDLSYIHLSEDVKRHWRTLGVFPASFDASAVSTIWELEDENETAKLLGLLRRYSLLDHYGTSSRYSLHDLLADYALSQMDEEEERFARFRHASHYREIMRRADNLYLEGGEMILQGLRLFDSEWEHIRVGQNWSTENINQSNEIARLCSDFTGFPYCIGLRQNPREQISWFEKTLEADRRLEDRQAEEADLSNLGFVYVKLGDGRKGIEFLEQGLTIARQIKDKKNEGAILGQLGLAYITLNDPQKALDFYNQGLVIAREIDDRRGTALHLNNIAQLYVFYMEDDESAQKYLEESLMINQAIGDTIGESHNLLTLGMLAYVSNRDDDALDYYRKAERIAINIQAKSAVAAIKLFTAPLLGIELGKDEAIRLFTDARYTFEELGMEKLLDQNRFKELLSMFERGEFPK